MERRARQSAAVDFLDEQHRPALGAQADHAISEAAAEDEEILQQAGRDAVGEQSPLVRQPTCHARSRNHQLHRPLSLLSLD